MDWLQDTVKVLFSPDQNKALEGALISFYRLPGGLLVRKELYVQKPSYDKFLRSKMRERTPFEAMKPFSELPFDVSKHPFLVVFSKCYFTFPSSREICLVEHLTEPNGLTKSVELQDSLGDNKTFDVYRYAEAEVVQRFLAEKGHLVT